MLQQNAEHAKPSTAFSFSFACFWCYWLCIVLRALIDDLFFGVFGLWPAAAPQAHFPFLARFWFCLCPLTSCDLGVWLELALVCVVCGGQQPVERVFPVQLALFAVVFGMFLFVSRQVVDLVGLFVAAGLRGLPRERLFPPVSLDGECLCFGRLLFPRVCFAGEACRDSS